MGAHVFKSSLSRHLSGWVMGTPLIQHVILVRMGSLLGHPWTCLCSCVSSVQVQNFRSWKFMGKLSKLAMASKPAKRKQAATAADAGAAPAETPAKKVRGKARTAAQELQASPHPEEASPGLASGSEVVEISVKDQDIIDTANATKINADSLSDVLHAVNEIKEHSEFQDITAASGVQNGKSAGFNDTMYKTNMESDVPIYVSSNAFFRAGCNEYSCQSSSCDEVAHRLA